MADPLITWPVALTIIGSVVGISVAIGGYIIQNFRRENKWKDPVNELSNRVIKTETEIESHKHRLNSIEQEVKDHEEKNHKHHDRIYDRMEEMTDMMIKLISGKSDSNE